MVARLDGDPECSGAGHNRVAGTRLSREGCAQVVTRCCQLVRSFCQGHKQAGGEPYIFYIFGLAEDVQQRDVKQTLSLLLPT